ncbi:unnamed protein product [Natator depressus]
MAGRHPRDALQLFPPGNGWGLWCCREGEVHATPHTATPRCHPEGSTGPGNVRERGPRVINSLNTPTPAVSRSPLRLSCSFFHPLVPSKRDVLVQRGRPGGASCQSLAGLAQACCP